MKRPNEQELLEYFGVGRPIIIFGYKESKIYYFNNKHTRINVEILHVSTSAQICTYKGGISTGDCNKCLWLRATYFDGQCLIPESEEEETMLMLGYFPQ